MTESGNRRPRPPFGQDPFGALLDPRFWDRFEKNISGGIEKAFRGISLRKEIETVTEATETAPAETREVLVANLDIPGVRKEDVTVEFIELDYGFTRLSISTKRGEDRANFKQEFRESVVAEDATATVDLGVLTVRVPVKTDDTKSRFEVPVV